MSKTFLRKNQYPLEAIHKKGRPAKIGIFRPPPLCPALFDKKRPLRRPEKGRNFEKEEY